MHAIAHQLPGIRLPTWDDAMEWLGKFRGFLATVFTHAGKAIVTARIRGTGTEPVYIGWGTGAGTAAASDITLFAEKDVDLSGTSGNRTAGTSSVVTTDNSNDTYRVVGTRTMTGAGPTGVTNAGLFDNASIGSGNLFMKGDFAAINLSNGDSIQFTFNLKFT
jgi:hypothetical protein